MSPIIPLSRQFDQATLCKIITAEVLVQRYRACFALFDTPASLMRPLIGKPEPFSPLRMSG